MVEIRDSSIHGKGVFAISEILSGSTISCDVLLISKNSPELMDHRFPWDQDHSSICIGFGSYLNHSNQPNLRIHSINKTKMTKTFITLRDIKIGEELLIKYPRGWDFQ